MFRGRVLGSITISMGVVSYDKHGKTSEELLRAADIAWYKAKQAGRDKVVVNDYLIRLALDVLLVFPYNCAKC